MKRLLIPFIGSICYGFIKDAEGNICIDEQQADVVVTLFNKYKEGLSLGGLQKLLEQEHICSPSGKEKWTRSSIDKLLSNGRYNPYIINDDLFYEVQAEKNRRTNIEYTDEGIKRKLTKYNSNNVLSGLLVCAECGANYRRITRSNGEVVWRCANRVEHGRELCQNASTISELKVIAAICSHLHISEINDQLVKERLASIYVQSNGELQLIHKKAREKSHCR